jgi:dolichol-phosphate mannosyltransferase
LITEPAGRRRQRVWVVLPAYDEEASLPLLLDRLGEAMAEADLVYRVVVVDDGSRDATPEIAARYARTMPLEVVTHPVNLGLGAAIRDGLTRAAEAAAPGDAIVSLDADNSHSPELIHRMVRRLREGNDVVIASRYRPGSVVRGVPAVRRVLSRIGGVLFKVVFPIPGVRDYTCGFRAYRAGALQQALADHGAAFFDQEGFQAMVDVLLKLRGRGLVFAEVPMVLRYDHKGGASKMRVGRTIGKTLGLMLRRRLGGR